MDDRALTRFMAKVEVDDETGCWEWTASRHPKGYAEFCIYGPDGKRLTGRAHRHSYEHFVGPIPDGLTIDHLCRNKGCVNPEHMEAVTSEENTRRSWAHRDRPTHCVNGHPFDHIDNRGWQKCSICCRANSLRYLERKKAS